MSSRLLPLSRHLARHGASARSLALIALLMMSATTLWGCAEADSSDVLEPYSDHAEPSDFESVPSSKADGVFASFDRNAVMQDSFFQDTALIDAAALQLLFENSPYGSRSWLADYTINGRTAAQIIHQYGVEFGINPLVLVSRIQVEASLVSRTEAPSQRTINRAAGCGCPDNQACASQYAGFEAQIRCAAQTMRNRFDDSVGGSGKWRVGKTERTLDPHYVTPQTHATASLYAYTPWVLVGRGGTWLAWNVTKKYERHMADLGYKKSYKAPFIGSPCSTQDDCDFGGGLLGFCYEEHPSLWAEDPWADPVVQFAEHRGFCTITCEGYCPDRAGFAGTFCIDVGANIGICGTTPADENDQCDAVPYTMPREEYRYVGTSNADYTTRNVCFFHQ